MSPNLNHLPAYAEYLLNHQLEAFVTKGIQLCREAELPLIKTLDQLSEQDLVERFTDTHLRLLQSIVHNKTGDRLIKTVTRLISNSMGITCADITARDLTLGPYITRRMFNHFLDNYTDDITLQKRLIDEVDTFTTSEELFTYKSFLNVQQKQLAMHKEFLLESQELAGIGSYIIDLKDNLHTYYSPQCLRIFGLEQAASFSQFINGVHPDDHNYVESVFNNCMAGTGEFEMEYRYVKNREKRIWSKIKMVFENGEPVLLKGTVRDVTQWFNLMNNLKETEKLYHQHQELNLMGSWSWDPASGILTWSQEMFRIFELEKGTRISFGQYLEFIHPDDIDRMRRELEQSTGSGSDHESIFKIVTGKGHIKLVHSVSRPVKNESGMISGFYGTCQDITNLHNLQKNVVFKQS